LVIGGPARKDEGSRAIFACALSAFALIGCRLGSTEPQGMRHVLGVVAAPAAAAPSEEVTPLSPSPVIGSVVHEPLDTPMPDYGRCRRGMASIDGRYCIDRYEASLIEVLAGGEERPFSPFTAIRSEHVRAVSEPSVYPQGYISARQAAQACRASGKRLCTPAEWQQACRGPENKKFGYATERQVGRCNDHGKNPIITFFGNRYDATTMNRPELNQLEGTLAKTGEHSGCSNEYGVFDMVGNLHEWVADPNGTFYGGYYQDVGSIGHGEGCGYVTKAHEARYHDYSTGFRCCSDPLGAEAPPRPPLVAAAPKRTKPKKRR
jgi:formylglycine-generating enzyme